MGCEVERGDNYTWYPKATSTSTPVHEADRVHMPWKEVSIIHAVNTSLMVIKVNDICKVA